MQIDGMNISQLIQVMKALKMAENDPLSAQVQLAQTWKGLVIQALIRKISRRFKEGGRDKPVSRQAS
jgi:hypothetical protein